MVAPKGGEGGVPSTHLAVQGIVAALLLGGEALLLFLRVVVNVGGAIWGAGRDESTQRWGSLGCPPTSAWLGRVLPK